MQIASVGFPNKTYLIKKKRLTADTLLAVQSGTLFVASHMYFLFYDNKHNYFHAKPNEKYI